MKMKIGDVKKLIVQVLSGKYYTTDEAEKMADVFLYAELTGKKSHGISKLLGAKASQDAQPFYKPKVIRETKLSAVIDGGGAAGPLVAQSATDTVINIAGKSLFGLVSINNIFSSIGALSYYARKIARENLIGIIMANAPKKLVHYGTIEPVYGTNPLAYGFPTEKAPIVFDMATAAITRGAIVQAKVLGKELPENTALDNNGMMTVDPGSALLGALLPFDRSYKGSGLAMSVELISGVLSGSSFNFSDGDWGATFMAISPDLTIGTDAFRKRASALVRNIKNSKTAANTRVHIPGYDTELKLQAAWEKGEIAVEPKIIDQLKKLIA